MGLEKFVFRRVFLQVPFFRSQNGTSEKKSYEKEAAAETEHVKAEALAGSMTGFLNLPMPGSLAPQGGAGSSRDGSAAAAAMDAPSDVRGNEEAGGEPRGVGLSLLKMFRQENDRVEGRERPRASAEEKARRAQRGDEHDGADGWPHIGGSFLHLFRGNGEEGDDCQPMEVEASHRTWQLPILFWKR
jgi:hypothetical protein